MNIMKTLGWLRGPEAFEMFLTRQTIRKMRKSAVKDTQSF